MGNTCHQPVQFRPESPILQFERVAECKDAATKRPSLTRKPVMTGRLTGCVRGILAPDMVAGSNPAALFTLTTSERMTKPKGNSQLTITRLQ